MKSLNSFATRSTLEVAGCKYQYHSLRAAEVAGLGSFDKLPFTIRILLENLLRNEDGNQVKAADIAALADWHARQGSNSEIAFYPARVLMQDFTGVPAIVDLAAMREAVVARGGDPALVNPQIPVDLVIDHSLMVDYYAQPDAFSANVAKEMERNIERYTFLRWGQESFENFRVVPPGTGICHQINLEYLARTVWSDEVDGEHWAYPDTLVGTDSHTTMINGLGVLGWGVGGIEAEAAMLGQPLSLLVPEVVGLRLHGNLPAGVTATDLVLRITEMLRRHGVVGKFVEFCGPGLAQLSLADRATISNMAPEYGATCGFFPIDQLAIDYLSLSGRDQEQILLTETYCKEQGLWRSDNSPEPEYSTLLELDLSGIVASLAGPKRPQDRVSLNQLKEATERQLAGEKGTGAKLNESCGLLKQGDLVIAAITSCTNTSNPAVMMAAGLLAQKAVERGLKCKPWVKTSLAPGSGVVSSYLRKAGLQTYLDQLGFNLAGYGCTTCIGNSGPLPEAVSKAITAGDLTVGAVLSGNRNFEGRIHPQVKANWLASPPLVVAFALAGTTLIDLTSEPICQDRDGQPVYLHEIWPSNAEVAAAVALIDAAMFREQYARVFDGEPGWRELEVTKSMTYAWDSDSTYIRLPSFFTERSQQRDDFPGIDKARILALFGDSITTDHISPAGQIAPESPAGRYLREHGVEAADFNSYGSRRGNHEVMMRGTLANIRLRNRIIPGSEGGVTRYLVTGETLSIYDAAIRYKEDKTPLMIVAGKEYGTGSSRDWAAKGTLLLGVKAVLAESFERIHRSNLVGMGVLPLQFASGITAETLQLEGSEELSLMPVTDLRAQQLELRIKRSDGSSETCPVICRIDTEQELACFRSGGILNQVVERLLKGGDRILK
jgi:aconitate hydratase